MMPQETQEWEKEWENLRNEVIISGTIEGESVIDIDAMKKRDIDFIHTERKRAQEEIVRDILNQLEERKNVKILSVVSGQVGKFKTEAHYQAIFRATKDIINLAKDKGLNVD